MSISQQLISLADVVQSNAKQYLLSALACSAWMFFSTALILLNKYLMASDGFRYPMALSGLGMVFSSVASVLACKVFRVSEANQTLSWTFYVKHIMPVGLFMALTLAFGNWVYLYLTVAFIQMLKAFTPIMTMMLTFLAGLETPERSLITSVVAITSGVAAAAYGELHFNVAGIVIMLLSQFTESVRLVMTQLLLQGCKFSAMEGLMYMAPACVFWLAIGSYCLEYQSMLDNAAFDKILASPTLYLSSAAMGFMVNITGYLTIKFTGSLTLKVLGTVKNSLIVWGGVLFFAEHVAGLQLFGYGVSILGFFMYNYVKMQAKAQKSIASDSAQLSTRQPQQDPEKQRLLANMEIHSASKQSN